MPPELYRQIWAVDQTALLIAIDQADDGTYAAQSRRPRAAGNVAIIPVYGMITQRGSGLDALFGGTSTDSLSASFSRALNDDQVGSIVLDVDSPGGTTTGVELAADRIYQARGVKPIVAVANSQMASAAYWIASSADQIVAVPGSDVGSIGVFRMHMDYSGALEQDGVKPTFISAGKYKTEANPYEPLSDEALAYHQAQVDATYDTFIGTVARNRGVTRAAVKSDFGQGRTLDAKQARQAGMVDRVDSMERVVKSLLRGKVDASVTSAIEHGLRQAYATGVPELLSDSKRRRLDETTANYL